MPDALNQLRLPLRLESFQPNQDDGRAVRARDSEVGVKIVIERNAGPVVLQSEFEDLRVFRACQSSVDYVDRIPSVGAQENSRMRGQPLVEQYFRHATRLRCRTSSSMVAAA